MRLPFLESVTASWTHRASGDAIVVLTLLALVAAAWLTSAGDFLGVG